MTGHGQSGRRPDGAAFVIAVLLAGLGGLLLWESGRIPNNAGYAGVGPGDVPWLVGLGLFGLAVWTLVAGFSGPVTDRPPPQQKAPVLWILAGLGLQLVLLKSLGFTIACGLLFACTATAFGKRNPMLTVPVGLVFAFCVYAVFDRVLQLKLPAGPVEMLFFGG